MPAPRRIWSFAAPALALALALCVALAGVAPARAETGARRVALVIGNGAYVAVPRLANPGNDAKLVARTLQAAGFTLVGGGAQLDLDKPHFDKAVEQFGRAIAGADVALFYYAGHGVQVDGTNYLVPVSANPSRRADLDFQMVSADLVLRQMSENGTRLNLLILDACRNNPFGGRGLRAVGGGLAEMRAPEGTLISYATQPGAVAQDGGGSDSPFTLALTDAMREPGLDIFGLFNRVGVSVKKATGGQQQPWLAASPIEGQFSFGAPPGGPAPSPPAPAAPPVETVIAPAPAVDPRRTSAPGGSTGPDNHCPARGTVVSGHHEEFDWKDDKIVERRITANWTRESLGSDPAHPNICIVDDKGEQRHLLVGFLDEDGHEYSEDVDDKMLSLVDGRDTDISFEQKHRGKDSMGWSAHWRLRGHEVLTIGGVDLDTTVFEIEIKGLRAHNYGGVGRAYYSASRKLWVRHVWKSDNSDTVTGWTLTGIPPT